MTTQAEPSQATAPKPRSDEFKEEIRTLKIKNPKPERDALLSFISGLGMVIGVLVTIIAYFLSHQTTNTLDQNDAQVVAMIGIAVTVLSGACFVRYSFASFLRFWLVRMMYEAQRGKKD